MRTHIFNKCRKYLTSLCVTAVFCAILSPSSLLAANNKPMDVIINVDMDSDDVAAMIFLGQAMKQGLVNIKAVTVINNGANLPGVGLAQAQCILKKIGLGKIPTGDSSVTSSVNDFPDSIRGVLGQISPGSVGDVIEYASGCKVPITNIPAPNGNAVSLIKRTLDNATKPIAILTFGPLTDIAKVVTDNNGAYKNKISAVYIMGGVTGIGSSLPVGNLCCGVDTLFTQNTPLDAGLQEFNIWVDPPSAQTVISEMSGKVYLTQLQGSNWVPLSKSFRTQLLKKSDTTATKIVYGLASAPINAPSGEADVGYGFLYWWDPLSAVAALFNDVVAFTPNVSIAVVQPTAYDGNITPTVHNAAEGALVNCSNSSDPNYSLCASLPKGIVMDGNYVPSVDLNGNRTLDYITNYDASLGGGTQTFGNPPPDEVKNTKDKFHKCFLNVLNENLNSQGSFPLTSKVCDN